MKTALIAVDIQTDFLPGGALGVTNGDNVIAPTLARAAEADILIATGDAHTPDHCSFAQWPVHCVAGTPGADINDDIADQADIIVWKATTKDVDAYSGFGGTVEIGKHPDAARIGELTTLDALLREEDVDRVQVTGLATDYCVKSTAIDAAELGYTTEVIAEAIAAVNLQPGDDADAIAAMTDAGVTVR